MLLFVLVGYSLLSSKKAKVSRSQSALQLEEAEDLPADAKNEITMSSFTRSQIKDGQKLWDMTAQKGRHISEDKQSFLDFPLLTIYNKDGSTTSVRADAATLFHSTEGIEKAELFTNVTVQVGQQMTLKTGSATFFMEKEEVHAPGEVDITADGLTIKGKTLDGNLKTNVFTIQDDVDTVVEPQK